QLPLPLRPLPRHRRPDRAFLGRADHALVPVPRGMKKKVVVGLTGGIGSGKSAVADEFAKLGATIVDTDVIRHELTPKGGDAIAEVRRLFGNHFIQDGAMDRKRMRDHVFAHPDEKKKLEALLHPLIREESGRRIAAAAGPYVVHVVPLLIESPGYRSRV